MLKKAHEQQVLVVKPQLGYPYSILHILNQYIASAPNFSSPGGNSWLATICIPKLRSQNIILKIKIKKKIMRGEWMVIPIQNYWKEFIILKVFLDNYESPSLLSTFMFPNCSSCPLLTTTIYFDIIKVDLSEIWQR